MSRTGIPLGTERSVVASGWKGLTKLEGRGTGAGGCGGGEPLKGGYRLNKFLFGVMKMF